MKPPFTRKILESWAGKRVFQEALQLHGRHAVASVCFEPPLLKGEVQWGKRSIRCAVDVMPDGSADNHCPCHDSRERGIICAHAVALGLALLERAYDPDREEKEREEKRKAARMTAVDDAQFLKRAEEGAPGATSARLLPAFAPGWEARGPADSVPLACFLEFRGQVLPLGAAPRDLAYAFTSQDDALLYVLEDIAEGPVPSHMDLRISDFLNLLDLLKGRTLHVQEAGEPITVNAAPVSSHLLVDLDRETGELLVMVRTELPYMKPTEFPFYFVGRKTGWVYGAGNLWPLERVLPGPLQDVYRQPAVVPRPAVPRFLEIELPLLGENMTVESDLGLDLFTIEPGMPKFRLELKGSPAALAAVLHAEYGDTALVAGKPDPAGHFALPDPDDLLRYTVRNPAAEARALGRLADHGFIGEDGADLEAIVGTREVLNFLAGSMPALRRQGWKVNVAGRAEAYLESVDFATPVVNVSDQEDAGWFEVDFVYEDTTGSILSPVDIQRALRKGESFVEIGDRTILLDGGAIQSMHEVFEDCASGEGGKPGSFRLNGVHAAYVKSSLDALDGIDVEAAPTWQVDADLRNRTMKVEAEPLPATLENTLRSYQKEGVYWLRFLARNGFSGILADEMGLGKTLQTLTWLEMVRAQHGSGRRPALIVCPTSLVENWAEEAARFVPGMKTLMVSGADRHAQWEKVGDADLVITSYALLRRDIDRYAGISFFAAALDEAQHIKNHSTQNAKAAKRIQATHRLVLTGTPIENSVADLWSIMDYLMPGYLGGYKPFRDNYELPIGRGDVEGESAQVRLRRKLHPFLLRRLKKDVAKDLPPKIEKTASCAMTADQQAVYRELVEASRRRLSDLVGSQGFERSRMEVLKTLLRLRQACCHLDLLKLPDLESNDPSGKLNLFFELMDEAVDGGHRVLVFSQFVSMLTILRRELEQRDLTYCYLDGSTKNRMDEVRRFNTDRSVPMFLISLKAGGTGLNLTGADMVVHFDPWWNPAVEDQATDRAHRVGQQRTVYCVKLITRNTVEEKVLALQRKKKAVIQGTLTSDEKVIQQLTWDDVQDLLKV